MTDWTQAACLNADADSFYPEKGGSTAAAKAVCWGTGDTPPCPIRDACLEDALERGEKFGVYGGYSERERRALRRGAA